MNECTHVSKSLCVSMHCAFQGTGGQKHKPFVPEERNVIGRECFLFCPCFVTEDANMMKWWVLGPSIRTGPSCCVRKEHKAIHSGQPSWLTGTVFVLRGADSEEDLSVSIMRWHSGIFPCSKYVGWVLLCGPGLAIVCTFRG